MYSDIKGVLRSVPEDRFVLTVESAICLFIALFILVPHIEFTFPYSLLLLLLVVTLAYSVLGLLFSRKLPTGPGQWGLLLMIGGLAAVVVQIEAILHLNLLEPTLLFYALGSGLAAVFGSYLVRKHTGEGDMEMNYRILWVLSILLFTFYPVSKLYLPQQGLGSGEVSALIMGVISIPLAVLFIYRIRSVDGCERWLDKGDMRRILGDDKGAEEAYVKALESGVFVPDVHTRLGDLMLHRGDHHDALVHYTECLDHLKDRNFRMAAMAALYIGHHHRAKELIIKGLNTRASPTGWFLLGKICGLMGESEREREGYRLALEMDDEHWPTLEALGDLCTGEQREEMYRRALLAGGYGPEKRKLLRKVGCTGKFSSVYLNPGYIRLWRMEPSPPEDDCMTEMLRYILKNMHRVNTATIDGVSDADNFTSSSENDREIKLTKDLFLAASGCTVPEDIPDDEMKYLHGINHMLRGDMDKAKELLDCITKGTLKPYAKAAVSVIHYKRGELDKAEDSIRDSLAAGYDSSCGFELLELIARRQGRWENALHYGKRSRVPLLYCSSSDTHISDIVTLASVRQLKEDRDISEDHPLLEGTIMCLNGEYKKARTLFEEVLDHEPNCPMGHLGRGLSLLGIGRNEDALEAFKESIYVENKGEPLVYFYSGIALMRMGYRKDAHALFRKVYADRPSWETNYHHLKRTGQ